VVGNRISRPTNVSPPTIALLTDYGDRDFFVASLKAVILSLQPEARIVDISHSLGSFNIRQGSYLLAACSKYFPPRTIFVVVVDPGVGTKRRLLLVKTKKYFFIAPDNGVLSGVLRENKPEVAIEVRNRRFFLKSVGRTFDGRDKMAPVAAWLSRGTAPEKFGPQISSWIKLPVRKPRFLKDRIAGEVVYIDKFGNCLTNIPSGRVEELKRKVGNRRIALLVGGKAAVGRRTYGAGRKGELIFLPGSQGTIEIAMKEASAAARLGAAVGDSVVIRSFAKETRGHITYFPGSPPFKIKSFRK
jgi:S-adenosylmethionine hydrolase